MLSRCQHVTFFQRPLQWWDPPAHPEDETSLFVNAAELKRRFQSHPVNCTATLLYWAGREGGLSKTMRARTFLHQNGNEVKHLQAWLHPSLPPRQCKVVKTWVSRSGPLQHSQNRPWSASPCAFSSCPRASYVERHAHDLRRVLQVGEACRMDSPLYRRNDLVHRSPTGGSLAQNGGLSCCWILSSGWRRHLRFPKITSTSGIAFIRTALNRGTWTTPDKKPTTYALPASFVPTSFSLGQAMMGYWWPLADAEDGGVRSLSDHH